MSIYIAHRRRKTNALDTLVLSEQECFQQASDTGALLRRACTAHVLERPASASRRAADVTDHDRICRYH